ncbi:MFS transporter [Hamadaea sp. NPDC050747]|uniref:MFS transporter n=1 Tax=Hamadaea sp. NPDC050747 TaxID=3155789 RepID=UPI003402ACDF
MSQDAEPTNDPRRWIALITMLSGAFMNLLDVSIANVALPSLRADLGASFSAVQWLLAGYTLAFAALLITGGRLGDMFGRKRLFLIGMVGFAVASALCGAAPTPGVLVGARILQGAAGALMVPQVLATIQVTFAPAERIKALGAFGATAGLGTVSGPLLGGLLIQADLFGWGWRSIFFINVAIAAIAVPIAFLVVRESRNTQGSRLDLPGVVLVTAGLLLFIYPIVQGRENDWPLWGWLMMAAGVLVLAFFGWYESRRKSPLVPMTLFGRRSFTAGVLTGLAFFGGIASFFLVLTFYLQYGLGFTPLRAGLTTLPFSIGVGVLSVAATKLAPKLGRTTVMIGAVVMALGIGGVIYTIGEYGPRVESWQLIPAMAIAGAGMGLVVAPLADIILAGVDRRDAGSASGVINTAYQVGNALGIAILGSIFVSLLGSQVSPAVDHVAPQIRAAITVPAAQDAAITGFEACLYDRVIADDTAVVPASCASAGSTPGLAEVGAEARERVFGGATQRTLGWQLGLLLVTLLLMTALPRGKGVHAGPPSA